MGNLLCPMCTGRCNYKHGRVVVTLLIKNTKYIKEGGVVFTKYSIDNSIAILIEDIVTHEPLATATVYMDGHPLPSPKHVWLKGWSENDGIPDALVDAGIVKLTGITCIAGYVEALQAEILVDITEGYKS